MTNTVLELLLCVWITLPFALMLWEELCHESELRRLRNWHWHCNAMASADGSLSFASIHHAASDGISPGPSECSPSRSMAALGAAAGTREGLGSRLTAERSILEY